MLFLSHMKLVQMYQKEKKLFFPQIRHTLLYNRAKDVFTLHDAFFGREQFSSPKENET